MRRLDQLVVVALMVAGAAVFGWSTATTTAHAANSTYDASAIARVYVRESAGAEARPTLVSDAPGKSSPPSAQARGASTTPLLGSVATEAGGARFVVNSAGDALDTARVTIPGGKYNYLLENPSKSGVFADSMGFNQASLDSALRSHLVDNFGTATPSVPLVGGGTKFSVTGPMIGPSGAKWTITTAWGVDVDETIRLITATP